MKLVARTARRVTKKRRYCETVLLDSATLSVTHGASHSNRGSYAPAHLVWVERMMVELRTLL